MKTARTILGDWSLTDLAHDTGLTVSGVRQWKWRGSIPVEHWPALLDAATRRGIPLSADDLVAAVRASRPGPTAKRVVIEAPADYVPPGDGDGAEC
jgi:hypothetical protein